MSLPPSNPNSARRQSSARRARRASVMDVRGGTNTAMKVYIRVRPFSLRELNAKMPAHSTVMIDTENPSILTTLDPAKEFRPQATFNFTRCFWSVLGIEGSAKDREMSQVRDAVDVFLNGGMNSTSDRRRSRAASLSLGSARPRLGAGAGSVVAASTDDIGVGSAAGMNDEVGVPHPPYAGQDEVYAYVGKPILDNALKGYNGCVFAYGQTGSGKTFTMLGYAPSKSDIKREAAAEAAAAADADGSDAEGAGDGEEDKEYEVDKASLDPNNLQGIIPRINTEMFSGLLALRDKDSSLSYRVEVSYYEIYNERIFDLLNRSKNNELKARNTPNGPIVEGLTAKVASKPEEVAKLIRKGSQERHTAANKFNDRSSRSHAILTFTIKQVYMDDDDTLCSRVSKLNLVDLAGSERTGAAGAEGTLLMEGNKINQSLMVLGRVIDCLADLSHNKSLAVPVPYRESNLTWLLSDSLGGNSMTSMIATISPHALNFEEMRQTIRYASRAKQIVQCAVVNEDPQRMLVRSLKAEIERLNQRLLEGGISPDGGAAAADPGAAAAMEELEERVRTLQATCDEQQETLAEMRERLGEDEQNPFGGSMETLRMQLDEANAEITRLQIELSSLGPAEENAAGAASAAEVTKAKERAAELETQLEAAEAARRAAEEDAVQRARALKQFAYHYTTTQPQLVMDACYQKTMAVFREYEATQARQGDQLRLWAIKGEKEMLHATTEREQAHEAEIAELRDRHAAALEALKKDSDARVQEAERHGKEDAEQAERRLREARTFFDQEKRRLEHEADTERARHAEELARVRAEYLADLQELRGSLNPQGTAGGGGAGAAAASSDAVVAEKEAQIDALRDKLAQLRDAHADDLRAVRSRHAEQIADKDAEIAEREAQKRQLEKELSDMRKDNLKLQIEGRNAVKKAQDEFKEKRKVQDELVALNQKMLKSWDREDVEDVAEKMTAVQDLLTAGGGGSGGLGSSRRALGPKVGSGSFGTTPPGSSSASAAGGEGGGATPDVAHYRDVLERLKAARREQKEKMSKFQKDVYTDVSRARGYTPSGAAASSEKE